MFKRFASVLGAILFSATIAAAITVSGTDSRMQNQIAQVGFLQLSAKNAITAAVGGGQTNAVQLVDGINRVTVVATAADSVKLPAAKAGLMVVVTNVDPADSLNVFPFTGDAVNALSPNAAYAIAIAKTVIFICAVDGTWNTVLTA